jgi:hypothetical protein
VTDPLASLRELAADCRVRIGTDIAGSPEEGGSGVWIAPGTVLTCAHVVPSGHNSKVQVGWRDHILIGTVTDRIPDKPHGGLQSYPDLAVIALDTAPEHPCVWLSESPPMRDLLVFGHSAEFGEGLKQAEIKVRWGGSHAFGKGRFWQFKGNELVSGMSGGPALDLSTGAVCGIVTATIGMGADRGGYLVPIEGLRHLGAQRRQQLLSAHDRFHGRDRRWTNLRASLPMSPGSGLYPVTATEEIDLLELLTQLPALDPAELLALVTRNSRNGRMPMRPTALRDVAYALLDSSGLDSEAVMSLIRMTHQLAGTSPKSSRLDLYDWTTAFATRHQRLSELRKLRKARALEDNLGGLISIEIVPGAARVDRFRLTVSVHQHQRGRRPIYQDQEPRHTLEQIKRVACDQLRIALGCLGGHAHVEFVVPIELFDEPFDELVPTKPYTNLGRKYHVVLRDYERQADSLILYDWRRRWKHIENSSPSVRWITCTENMTQDEFSAELEQHPETAIVALMRSPSSNQEVSDLLRVALDSGIPVAVWRRDTCPEHDANIIEPRCSGRRFHKAFSPVLSAPKIHNLPEAVRMLRNRAATKDPKLADRDCLGTVLLWDQLRRYKSHVSNYRRMPNDRKDL